MAELPRKITDDPYGAAILIRRLVTEQGSSTGGAISLRSR